MKRRGGLHLAASGNVQVLTKCLLEDGAVPDPLDEEDQTPLFYALSKRHEKIVKHYNADVNQRDLAERTPLHLAASRGDEKIVKLLLDRGTHVNPPNLSGRTSLHLAALYGHEKVVKLLLDCNADVDLVDRLGETALHLSEGACESQR